MPKPEIHVFVCSQQRPPGHPRSSCAEKGAGQLLQTFSEKLIAAGLSNTVSLVATGCLGPCRAGANVLVHHPATAAEGGVWYMAVDGSDVDGIIKEHLVGGAPYADKLAPDAIWQ